MLTKAWDEKCLCIVSLQKLLVDEKAIWLHVTLFHSTFCSFVKVYLFVVCSWLGLKKFLLKQHLLNFRASVLVSWMFRQHLQGISLLSQLDLSQCHSVHHKSHTGWPGFEPGSLWWETGDQPPESQSKLRSGINKLTVCMQQNCRIGVLASWFSKCIKSCRDNVSKIFFYIWDTGTNCTVNYKFNIQWVTVLQCWISYLDVCLSAGRKHWTPKQYVDQVAAWVFEGSSVGHASRIDMERVLKRLWKIR